jgi:small subunit ribosomal protein S4e
MHLKRQESPKNWPIERKGTTYLVRPNYSIDQGVPILIVIRDMLKFAKDRREVKKALNSKQILLDHRVVFDDRDNALLFDIITIIPPKDSNLPEKNYRVIIGKNKKFELKEIHIQEAGHKVSKVINKTTLKGKKVQINLSDGRNFLSDLKCKTNDSVLINLKNKKLEKCIPMKKDSKAIVFAGKHAGEEGVIKEIDEEKNMVKLESNGETTNILIKQIMVLE